jgi:hypothetical protein
MAQVTVEVSEIVMDLIISTCKSLGIRETGVSHEDYVRAYLQYVIDVQGHRLMQQAEQSIWVKWVNERAKPTIMTPR